MIRFAVTAGDLKPGRASVLEGSGIKVMLFSFDEKSDALAFIDDMRRQVEEYVEPRYTVHD